MPYVQVNLELFAPFHLNSSFELSRIIWNLVIFLDCVERPRNLTKCFVNALRLADPDIFVGGFARVCQRPRQPVVISREVFNREYDLIRLLQNIFMFRILEYHGNYYLPRFILNIQQGPIPIPVPGSFIGLQRPPPNSQWPLPCAYTNEHTAEVSITQYGNRFGVNTRYV
jgi:hypothetical protein